MSNAGESASRTGRAPWRIAVDVGGTFTDMILADAEGAIAVFKAPSTPPNPSAGVFAVLGLAARDLGITVEKVLASCDLFLHGSTIATNTMLEGKGARVGLMTTSGFRDSLEIRRGIRMDQLDHRRPYPPVLVPRFLRLPIGGRIAADGSEIDPLAQEDVHAAIDAFEAEGVEAIAVCLLNSVLEPKHEQALAKLIRKRWGKRWLSLSSIVSPTLGEYERSSTTVVNAYIAPKVMTYLANFEKALREHGFRRTLVLLQNNGGGAALDQLVATPIRLLLSGPAAGVGALGLMRQALDCDDLISMEIGGTSCDVIVMRQGSVPTADELSIGGYHVTVPSVEVHTVGAGGGTIAGVDRAGMLWVGPQGAGASPGPACYGLGGTRPTVTDALVVLGRMRPGPYAGGAITIDAERANAAIVEQIAKPLGLSLEAAASGVIFLLEQRLQHAVEWLSLNRGFDPRRFVLVACGGAGPMHGASVGRRLGCSRVYAPRLAGAFCVLGMLNSDVTHDLTLPYLRPLDETDMKRLAAAFAPLEAAAIAQLSAEGFNQENSELSRALDLRYREQQVSIRVSFTEGDSQTSLRDAFEREYERLYAHRQPASVDIGALWLTGRGKLPPVHLPRPQPAAVQPVPIQRRPIYLDEQRGWTEVAVYAGADLSPGHRLAGPLMVEEATTTLFVGPDDTLEVDAVGNFLIHLPVVRDAR